MSQSEGTSTTATAVVNIVQYILVRGDLISKLEWPLGAVVAQACHASSASIHLFYEDPITQSYLQDLDNMHKVILEVPDEQELLAVEKVLLSKEIKFKKWIEQPENYPTCIALKPYVKTDVQKLLRKYKMLK
uniref:peptidyl-tRNA hydrolase n=1 Tax=Cacopsylla melanoneura TaxID=428564 RepID=A0A8D8SM13_9HEMI